VVVRFNNWATRSECREHTLPHGTLRCDVLVTHLDLHSATMGKRDVGRPRLVVIGIPAPFQIDTIPAKLDRWHADAAVAMVNPYWNRQPCQALSLDSLGHAHPLPTLGYDGDLSPEPHGAAGDGVRVRVRLALRFRGRHDPGTRH
ncbi:MAG TPA: hypothetical protein VHZ24_01015, partial [Pirellulales bacterium]|nr:hypothetical protein [Pirellulales bacterium]